MAKRRQPKAAPAPMRPPAAMIVDRSPVREIDVLVLIAAILCIAVGYLSREALNPDGVSYLDLATAILGANWSHFAQGYWSPLLPFLTSVVARPLGLAGADLVPVTHWLNTLAALGALLIIWRWGRRAPPPFGRAAVATFMICSWGLPRIEAVTPDVLLLAVAVAVSHELLVHRGRRWAITGMLLGLAFLAKTSTWPWLIVAVVLRFVVANDRIDRRSVVRSALVCGVIMLVWIVPMSLKAGQPTLGSSGRLNYSWYIDANSSRLPDTDLGGNTAYSEVPIGDGKRITVATFDDAANWTYQPWGDPTAWRQKVLTETGGSPTLLELIGYWARNAGLVFGLWFLPVILLVLVPVLLLQYRPAMWRDLVGERRDVLVVMVLGVVGLLQFVAIHAEPRLLAPFAFIFALAWISWCCDSPPDRRLITHPVVRLVVGWLGIVGALVFAVPKMVEGVHTDRRLNQTVTQAADLARRLASTGQSLREIAIVGPAAPVMSAAYWMGAHIVMQIPPRSVEQIASLPPAQIRDVLLSVFSGKVSIVWQTSADGGMKMLIVPQKP